MDDKQLAFKITAILLDYPEDFPNTIEIHDLIEKLKNTEVKEQLLYFIKYIEERKNEQLCQEYVETFDFAKDTTLYLTYPKLGDKRERGDSLVKIKSIFANANLPLRSNELPDYLPLLLEFASIAPKGLAEEILNMYMESIEQLYTQLALKNSIYQYLIKACLFLAAQPKQLEINGGVS